MDKSPTRLKMRDLVSEAEWQVRVDLACLNRAAAYYGWDDQTLAHISCRAPDNPGHYLIGPYSRHFDELTASQIHKLDNDNNHVIPAEEVPHPFAMPFHRALYRGFPEANCILHVHSLAAGAVGMQKHGLLPYNQSALMVGPVGYHPYLGLNFTDEEGQQMIDNIKAAGPKCQTLILRGHGCTAWGRNVADAFILAYNLIRGCEMQLLAMAGGTELVVPDAEVIERTRGDPIVLAGRHVPFVNMNFETVTRRMSRLSPGFAD